MHNRNLKHPKLGKINFMVLYDYGLKRQTIQKITGRLLYQFENNYYRYNKGKPKNKRP